MQGSKGDTDVKNGLFGHSRRSRGWDDLREQHWNIYLVCTRAELLQSCPILWGLQDCNPPDSFVHGILQARIPEWVALLSCRGYFWPKDWTWGFWDSWIAGRFFTAEPLGKPKHIHYLYKMGRQWEFNVWLREPKAGALWQPGGVGWGGRGKGGSGRRGHMYAYGRFMLMWGRDTYILYRKRNENKVTQSCPTLCKPHRL